jgi:ABC-type phosphate transport system permease subunit
MKCVTGIDTKGVTDIELSTWLWILAVIAAFILGFGAGVWIGAVADANEPHPRR